jgi:hypothetical protein
VQEKHTVIVDIERLALVAIVDIVSALLEFELQHKIDHNIN